MSKNIYTIPIDLNDTKVYSVLRMLSFICTQSPYPPFLYYVNCCHFLIYVYNIIV